MKRFIFLLIISTPFLLKAQYKKSPGFAKVSGGYGFSRPLIQDLKTPGLWQGFHFRSNWLEVSRYQGQLGMELKDGRDTLMNGTRFNLGWNMPIAGLSVGNRVLGVKGFLIQPILGVHVGGTKIGTQGLFNAGISPGLHFQFPYGLIGFRMNTGYNFGENDQMREDLQEKIRGFIFEPRLTLQVDGLYTLMDPEVEYTGTARTEFERLEVESLGDGWYRVTSWSEVNYTDFYMNDIRPFWAVTPKYEIGISGSKGSRFIGGALSGRAGAVMADLSYDMGLVRFNGPTFDSTDLGPGHFRGSYPASRAQFGIGGDVITALQSIFFGRTLTNRKKWGTKLTRVYLGLRSGFVFPGKTRFKEKNAEKELDNLFKKDPNLERNPDTDPREIGTGLVFSPFISVEFSTLSVFWQATVGDDLGESGAHVTFGAQYLIPVGRISSRSREKEQ